MREIEANKQAWNKLAKEHYAHFKARLTDPSFKLNPIVEEELGDVKGKRILHLQCNTGADSILLSRRGAIVTGVDLADENIFYANQLAADLGIETVDFIASDVLKLSEIHAGEYDIVMTTDGAIGWLPDLNLWGKTISKFLKAEGYFYLHDAHPFVMIFDEEALDSGTLIPKYPYFQKDYEAEKFIGGYASEALEAENYYWSHQMSTIISGLLEGGLYVTYMKEYDYCAPGMNGNAINENGFSHYPLLDKKIPLVMSLKAKKLK